MPGNRARAGADRSVLVSTSPQCAECSCKSFLYVCRWSGAVPPLALAYTDVPHRGLSRETFPSSTSAYFPSLYLCIERHTVWGACGGEFCVTRASRSTFFCAFVFEAGRLSFSRCRGSAKRDVVRSSLRSGLVSSASLSFNRRHKRLGRVAKAPHGISS
jgi:hypothetical protein